MTEIDFTRIQLTLCSYAFSSMKYLEYDDVSNYDIEIEQDDIIILFGFNREADCYEYHWAANNSESLLHQINLNKNFLIPFIPHEWVKLLEQSGLKVRSAWQDYFMKNIEPIESDNPIDFLSMDECLEASDVTMACKGQSRGFTGQTADWVCEWLTGSQDSDSDTGVRNNAILVERTTNNEIAGIVCTGTYAHNSEKGAIVWIREVAVKPEFQNKGIARKLILQAITYGKAKGATRAFLAADECNTGALHLYTSIGFVTGEDESQIDMIHDRSELE